MLSFESDYVEGAHEKILARFAETNLEKLPGYGADRRHGMEDILVPQKWQLRCASQRPRAQSRTP